MKTIYVGHSREFNFQKELYEPLRKSKLNTIFNIILPHEKTDDHFDSKRFLKKCDLMIAEVSFPSTGLGIELGWANAYKVPIIFTYKKGSKISGSLKVLSENFIEYQNIPDMISKIEEKLRLLNK